MASVEYQIETIISSSEFTDVLKRSTLAERRPVDDIQRIDQMLKNANLIITARSEGKLIGIARSLSDFTYCTYLSDLAVDLDYQKGGIGKELIRRTREAAPFATLILLSAPAAIEYYPKLGMKRHEHCYVFHNTDALK